MWAGLVDLLYPRVCAGCRAPGAHLCDGCLSVFERITQPLCRWCGAPLGGVGGSTPERPGPDHGRTGRCRACLASPPGYAIARSLFIYGGPLRDAIHAMKYRGWRGAAGPLGRLLAEEAPPEVTSGISAVVPVPLYPSRLAARGFNQAALLARPLASRLDASWEPLALRRLRQDLSQADLGAAGRHANVRGAFVPGARRIRGRVLLVDDVFSTGATATECALALRAAGASEVAVLTLARAVLTGPGGVARAL